MERDFLEHISEIKTWYLRLGYLKNLVESEMNKTSFHNKFENRTLKRILLFATYHPLLYSLGIVLSKKLNILYLDEEVKKIFYP